MASLRARAIAAIERHGVLLVFPQQNRPDPPSLWSALYPRSPMRWQWDEHADDRVVTLWHLREELSRTSEVVYAKWMSGRATLFSPEAFAAISGAYRAGHDVRAGLEPDALRVLRELVSDSPQGTKALRAASDLTGRMNDATFQRAVKVLSARLLVIGHGEIDEGAFPSLALAATQTIREALWDIAATIAAPRREAVIDRALPAGGALRRHHDRTLRSIPTAR